MKAARLCLLVFVLAMLDAGCVVRRLWIDKGGMTDADKTECAALTTGLPSQFMFSVPVSSNPVSPPGKAAVFCGVEGRGVFFPSLYTHVTIYGITDQPAQDGILNALEKVPRKGFKPIIVRFYERELWTVTYSQDGTTSSQTHEIDKEQLLRQAVLR